MKKQKRIIVSITIFLFIYLFANTKTYAASIGMGINKTTAYVGDSFTVTISGINGKVNISCNSNVTIDKIGSYFVEGSLTINGTAKAEGTGTVTVTPVDVTTTSAEPEEITATASRSITITQKPAPTPNKTTKTTTTTTTKKTPTPSPKPDTTPTPIEDNFYISTLALKGIKDNGDEIDIELFPEFSKDIFEYTCNISSDFQKIEVEPDAGEYTNFVVTNGLEELKVGENIITVTLSAEGHDTKTYTIKLIKEENVVQEAENNVDEDKKDTPQIVMPVWEFVLLQAIIILVEICIFKIKRSKH